MAESLPDPERQPVWQDEALCLDWPSSWWFPDRHSRDTAAEARRICFACPVQIECIVEGIETGSHYGLWGGTTRTRREKIAKYSRDKSVTLSESALRWVEHIRRKGYR